MLALPIALGLTLTACSLTQHPVEEHLVDASELQLGDATVAIFMNTDDYDASNFHGYLVLIDDDGTMRSFATDGMWQGLLDWSSAGLVFTDHGADYHLSDTLTVTDSEKPTLQQTIRATDDGGSIALYNDGHVEDGYAEQLVTHTPQGSRVAQVEGYYQVTGFCDGELFGLAEPSGPYVTQAEQEGLAGTGNFGFTSLMLTQLSGTASGTEELVGMQEVTESDQLATDAPCASDLLHHLAAHYPSGGQEVVVLRSWDVETGTHVEHELTFTGGTVPPKSEDYGFESLGYDRNSLRDGALEWLTIDGRILSTDIETGETSELFELAQAELVQADFDPSTWERIVEFSADTVSVLTYQLDGGYADIVEYDRATGAVISQLDLSDLGETIQDGAFITDFATKPV